MKRERTQGLKIKITKGTYRKIVEAAFRNCRTPEQEASFMVERQLSSLVPERIPARYDDPVPGVAIPEPENIPAPQDEIPPVTDWGPEEEARVNEACKAAGMTEAEITAAKLIHKTPDAVIASLKVIA